MEKQVFYFSTEKPPKLSPTILAPKNSPFKGVRFQTFSFRLPPLPFSVSDAHTHSASHVFAFPSLSLHSVDMLIPKQGLICREDGRGEEEGKWLSLVPVPFTSQIKSSNSNKAGWGGMSYSDDTKKMPVINAGGRIETGLLWSCSCCHLLSPLTISLTSFLSYPFSLSC